MNIDDRKMKRLDLLHRSIDTAYQDLKSVLYKGDEDKTFMVLKSLLDLIFSADEMHFDRKGYYKRRDNDEKGNLLNGLRYAANLLKHEKICIEIHKMITTPMFSFPLEIPEEGIEMGVIQAKWIKVDTLPNPKIENNKHHINQKNVYNNHLVNNEIVEVIEAGIEFLLKEKEILKQHP